MIPLCHRKTTFVKGHTRVLPYLQPPELAGQIQRSLLPLVHQAGIRLVLQQHLRLPGRGSRKRHHLQRLVRPQHIHCVCVCVFPNRVKEHWTALFRTVLCLLLRPPHVAAPGVSASPLADSSSRADEAGRKECVSWVP